MSTKKEKLDTLVKVIRNQLLSFQETSDGSDLDEDQDMAKLQFRKALRTSNREYGKDSSKTVFLNEAFDYFKNAQYKKSYDTLELFL